MSESELTTLVKRTCKAINRCLEAFAVTLPTVPEDHRKLFFEGPHCDWLVCWTQLISWAERCDEFLPVPPVAEAVTKIETLTSAGGPRCPGCGEPALDGHITCGDAACGSEAKWARHVATRFHNEVRAGQPPPEDQKTLPESSIRTLQDDLDRAKEKITKHDAEVQHLIEKNGSIWKSYHEEQQRAHKYEVDIAKIRNAIGELTMKEILRDKKSKT